MHTKYSRIAFVLGLVAALLAWSAVGVRYARSGTVDWPIVAAGAFCAALAWSARAGRLADTSRDDASTPGNEQA